jgi:DNA-directed RNA polymerase subunit RPC12/RpoP
MQIKCPNCGFEGRAKRRKNRGSMLTTALLILGGFIFPWLWILAFIAGIWLIVEKRDALCPKCDWKHVIKT